MKIIKTIILALVVFIILILIAGLFVDGSYNVVRGVNINKSTTEVFNYVLYLKNQDNYSVWAGLDPEMQKIYYGTDGTVGFVSGWESNNPDVGKGEQEIVAITPGERIDYQLRFIEPFETTDDAFMTTTTINDNSTNVQWGVIGKMAYPMNLMLLIMNMEEMLGKDLQSGLDNLKAILEKGD